MNKILYDGEYIAATAQTPHGGDENADAVEEILRRQPDAPEGFVMLLRRDLTWEMVPIKNEEEGENGIDGR